MKTMATLILLMAYLSLIEADPDYKITTNINLSTDSNLPTITYQNSTTSHAGLRRKVKKLENEVSQVKITATKDRSNVKTLEKKVVALEKELATGDTSGDQTNICTLNMYGHDCGKCRCKPDVRLLKGHYCDCRHHPPMKDCASFKAAGFHKSGVYVISMTGIPILVFCDQEIDGGGWIVFQRRLDGTINFYRNWQWYKNGFGDIQHEHWLGNDHIHQLTRNNKMQLRIEMTYFENHWKNFHAKYTQFRIEDENNFYRLHLAGYSGNNGNSMAFHYGMKFSTFDRDHDIGRSGNCAAAFKGGWWYKNCHNANLNGRYFHFKEFNISTGIHWQTHDKHESSMLSSEMKLKPRL